MLKSTPKYWVVLAVILVLIAGGAFYALKPQPPKVTNEAAVPEPASRLGVINIEKVIESHPNYPQWLKIKQQQTTILQDLEDSGRKFEIAASENFQSMNQGIGTIFEQEFNAKMKAKYDELQGEAAGKAEIIKNALDIEFEEYAKKLEEEYQPELFDLYLKLSVLQLDEAQAKSIQEKMGKLKQEQAEKLMQKNSELSLKMDEQMAPEVEKINKEMDEYATKLNAELGDKMTSNQVLSKGMFSGLAGENSPEAEELKKLEEQVLNKRREADALYEAISQDVRYKIIEVAIKQGLDTVVSGHQTNINAVDITDLVIAEFKK